LGIAAMTLIKSAVSKQEDETMSVDGDYLPSPEDWVRNQVQLYESSGGTQGNTMPGSDLPVIIITSRGNKSGKVRKTPVMRVEHQGEYALVAATGGAPNDPDWYRNLMAAPEEAAIQDGPAQFDVRVRELSGAERETWWQLAVHTYPAYGEHQAKIDRTIPVLVATKQ
jgi:deazaflavin-dependent oxidoreductase (nitroreductase family)